MIHKTEYDAVIIGGGLAGLTTACCLARGGLRVACIEQNAHLPANDLRSTVISYGSRKILEDAGIWARISGHIGIIRHIEVLDGDSPVLLNFLSVEMENKAFGWNVLNKDLRAAMMAELSMHTNAHHLQGVTVRDFIVSAEKAEVILGGGQRLGCKLVIGADGRHSFVREWMDIPVRSWPYHQRAVVCTVRHQHPHHDTAVEHFWPAGPFAILPMGNDEKGNHLSSVVFTEHGPQKSSLMKLGDGEFQEKLTEKFPERYGAIQMASPRASYPLSMTHASRYIGSRMALVADAAHAIHPIAGQGLNLGFRDVAALTSRVIAAHQKGGDIGAKDILEDYQRARRFDNMAMVAVTDGFVRLFSSRLPGIRPLRKMGMKTVAKIPAAKRFFMRQAMGDR